MKEKLLEIKTKINDLQEKQKETLNHLHSSLLIKSIWSGAFDDGLPVYFSGKQKLLPIGNRLKNKNKSQWGFISAWFRKDNGFKYYLTELELLTFKPDCTIHPEYKVTNND